MALTALTSATVVIEIVLPVGKLPLMICSKQAVSCHVCFNFSHLNSRLLALHSGNSPSRSPTKCMSSIFVILKFKRAYLKFPVSGRSKQASKQAYIHTHVRTEVTLVWGSLRLAPMNKASDLNSSAKALELDTFNRKSFACL